jgi:glutaminase
MSVFVSTGRLPTGERVRGLVDEAFERYRSNREGETSDVYPALRDASPDRFGVAVTSTDGDSTTAGDADDEFAMMSVSNPFVFALVCEALGADRAREALRVNATGLPFDSLEAVARSADGRTNPMVNAGAIAATSLVPGRDPEARWAFVLDGLSRFAGRPLTVDDEVYISASATNHRNRELARALDRRGRLGSGPDESADRYTRQCSLAVSARDLATMGATLAGGGVNPLTGDRVVDADECRCTLAVMTTPGLYETSGDWLYDVGLPGKSGIGGGIVTVAPGKGGLGAFASRLDAAGNSVKGQLTARLLSRALGLDLFVSEPVRGRLD